MLELQSLQKEQQRREQLLKLQKDYDFSVEVTVPLRKGIRRIANHSDELQMNNNRDTLHFDGDANDDDIGTTVADDIILMKTDMASESSIGHDGTVDSGTRSATITVRNHFHPTVSKQLKANYLLNIIYGMICSHKTLSPIWTTDLTQIQCQPLTKQIIVVQIQL